MGDREAHNARPISTILQGTIKRVCLINFVAFHFADRREWRNESDRLIAKKSKLPQIHSA
jgi:hypothetical protein